MVDSDGYSLSQSGSINEYFPNATGFAFNYGYTPGVDDPQEPSYAVGLYVEDENGDKAGKNDKKCVIEARIEKKKPIAVTSNGDTPEKAFYDALHKMKRQLTTEKEKIKAH